MAETVFVFVITQHQFCLFFPLLQKWQSCISFCEIKYMYIQYVFVFADFMQFHTKNRLLYSFKGIVHPKMFFQTCMNLFQKKK